MDPRSTLHWGALLLALLALSWMLVSYVAPFVILLPLFAIGGGAALLASQGRVAAQERNLLLTGALVLVVVYGLWLILQLAATPFTINVRGTRLDWGAAGTLGDFAGDLGAWLPAIAAVGAFTAFFAMWARREQIIAGVGAGIVILVHLLGALGVGGETLGSLLAILFPVGFLVLAVALIIPVLTEYDHPTWQTPAAGDAA